MQGGGDPFSGFGHPFGGFGGFGGPRSLVSNFFGGRDPFDDPFFTQPFGGMFQSNFFGPGQNPFALGQPSGNPFEHGPPRGNPFEHGQPRGHPFEHGHPRGNPFEHGQPRGHPFGNGHGFGFLEQQAPQPPRSTRGPIIEELNSDDENEEKECKSENKENPRKHGRSSLEPFVEDPDDEADERRSKLTHYQSDFNRFSGMASRPQGHSYAFQSSTVSYGGANGTYYTSSKTRRTGSDGLTFEESKEANSATGQASHRVLKGIHDKGHSVSRKLNSDGRVDTMQTLHNLNEDEVNRFEDEWKGRARKHLPGLNEGHCVMGSRTSNQDGPSRNGGRALPSTERSHNSGSVRAIAREVDGPSKAAGTSKGGQPRTRRQSRPRPDWLG